MANPIFSLLSLTILSLLIPHSHSSLPTVSISQINKNQTLICAITKYPTQQQTNLDCTSILPPYNDGENRHSFVGIVGGNQFICGLIHPFQTPTTSIIVCWRFSGNGSIKFKRIYVGPRLKEINSGNDSVCGIVNSTNQLLCWPWNRFDRDYELNRARFSSSVAVGSDYVCGMSEFGRIICLGSNQFNISNHSVNGSVVSAGFNRVCAINSSNGLDCWGETMTGKPTGEFKSVVIGDNRFCAIRVNGTVICWGKNGFGLPGNLERVSYEGLQVNRGVFCGISTSNYSLYCWGNQELDSSNNFSVFENVVPGLCKRSCDCGAILNYETFCEKGLMICEPCVNRVPPETLPFPVSPPPEPRNGGWSSKMVVFVVVGSVGSFSFVLVFIFLIFRFCKSSEGSRVHDSGPMEEIETASRIRTSTRILVKKLSHLISIGNVNHLEEFALKTIIDAAGNFSENHRIGVGSFGSVYHGSLNGRKVAIKRAEIHTSSSVPNVIKKNQEDTNNAFLNELEFLSRVNHKNLVQLLGFCEEENELILVYEFMENGSLHDHLHKSYNSYIMSWPARIKVALDAARGLEYLHVYAEPPIIHRDIKSSNILLDTEWTGKVSDFGLSLMGPPDDVSHLSLRAAGTVGYMDPEYYKFEQLTTKSDVYSFGVVLLELLSGSRAIHKNELGERRNVVDSVVPYIENDEIHRILDHKVNPPTPFEIEAVKYVGYLAADCVTLEGRDRPTMSELVTCLEGALAACLAVPSYSCGSDSSSSCDIRSI